VEVGGRLSGPFERLGPDRRAVALEGKLALDDVGLPDPRQTVPVMAEVQRRHPSLNVLNTEAAAAALLLGAKMVLSPSTANGQLRACCRPSASRSKRSSSHRPFTVLGRTRRRGPEGPFAQ
jgi:hypothetical protein